MTNANETKMTQLGIPRYEDDFGVHSMGTAICPTCCDEGRYGAPCARCEAQAKADMDAAIKATASLYLRVFTLEEQGVDHLDYHEVSVASIRAALAHAYSQGKLDGATRN